MVALPMGENLNLNPERGQADQRGEKSRWERGAKSRLTHSQEDRELERGEEA